MAINKSVQIIDRFLVGTAAFIVILIIYGIFSEHKELLAIGLPFGFIIGIYALGTVIIYIYNIIKKLRSLWT